jgi:hypothetical protein
MLLADDIHNETNTRSIKEMDKAVAIITSNILPTLNPKSWVVFIGTPWRQGDVLQYLKATETYDAVSTPIYTEIELDQIDSPASTESDSNVPSSVISSEGASQLFNAAARPEIPFESNELSPSLETDQSLVGATHASPSNPEGGETPPLPMATSSVISSEPDLRLFNGAGRREIPFESKEQSPSPETDQPNNSQFNIQHSEFTISSPPRDSSSSPTEPPQPDPWLSRDLTWADRFPSPSSKTTAKCSANANSLACTCSIFPLPKASTSKPNGCKK